MDGQITIWQCFADMDREIKTNLNNIASNFIELGFLFKKARDGELFKEAGYETVYEYIEKEYHIKRTQALRFMQLNDKYSLGGNSKELNPQYIGYGSSKLIEMLGIPEEIREEITPDASVKDLREIKQQIISENSCATVAQNPVNTIVLVTLRGIVIETFKSEKEGFKQYFQTVTEDRTDTIIQSKLLNIIAPSKFRMIKLPGYNVMIKETIINAIPYQPGLPKCNFNHEEFAQMFYDIFVGDISIEASWEEIYRTPFEETKPKEEIKPKEVAKIKPETKPLPKQIPESKEAAPEISDTEEEEIEEKDSEEDVTEVVVIDEEDMEVEDCEPVAADKLVNEAQKLDMNPPVIESPVEAVEKKTLNYPDIIERLLNAMDSFDDYLCDEIKVARDSVSDLIEDKDKALEYKKALGMQLEAEKIAKKFTEVIKVVIQEENYFNELRRY